MLADFSGSGRTSATNRTTDVRAERCPTKQRSPSVRHPRSRWIEGTRAACFPGPQFMRSCVSCVVGPLGAGLRAVSDVVACMHATEGICGYPTCSECAGSAGEERCAGRWHTTRWPLRTHSSAGARLATYSVLWVLNGSLGDHVEQHSVIRELSVCGPSKCLF